MKYRCLALLFVTTECLAQTGNTAFEVGGYLKYLISESNVPAYGNLTISFFTNV